MLFNSFPFVFFFLPLSVGGFFVASAIGKQAGRGWLALASLAFYTWWHPPFTLLLLISIAFNYGFGRLLLARQERPGQSALLVFALAGNLGALFYYKYAYAIASSLFDHGLTHAVWMDSVLLPLGISFFTFTQIGFLVDCRAGTVQDRSPVNYVLFVTFFPHLIAGPILHHREIMPQFARDATYRMDPSNVAQGVALFFIGLFKKTVIADPIAQYVGGGFADPSHLAGPAAWGTVLAYSLQLYFDFSGYSDMAIGIARMCNLQFPLNFNSPYRARNIIDFWQRWHMTLTRYLTLYLYNPLAMAVVRWRAARGILPTRQATAQPRAFAMMVAMPMFVTMALAGIWHGAGLQFLVFGLLHAAYLTINHAWRSFGPNPARAPWLKRSAWHLACLLLTYLAVLVAQVFFRANSAADGWTIVQAMAGLHGFEATLPVPLGAAERLGHAGAWLVAHHVIATAAPGDTIMLLRQIVGLVLCYGIVFFAPNSQQIVGLPEFAVRPRRVDAGRTWLRLDGRWGILIGLVAVAAIMGIGAKSEFIYFQF